jgi:V8-like Glu-specific endopeptidase
MNEILNPAILSYPFHLPEGRELHLILSDQFPAYEEALDVALQTGLRRQHLTSGKTAYHFWVEILTKCKQQGWMEKLINAAAANTNNQSAGALFNSLLNDTPVSFAARPALDNNGSPAFISDNDKVSRPEALLFFDDLSLPVGRLPAFINTLTKIQEFIPSVCHLLVDFNGALKHGTGFRVAAGKLLTNWHVVHDEAGNAATGITARFMEQDDGNNGWENIHNIVCNAGNVISDKPFDWALLTAAAPMSNTWPVISLRDAVEPKLNSEAFIIQHPSGQPKRLGFVRNKISNFNNDVVHYLTDTQEGSSGSPVLDANGKLIALHHAGGIPQVVNGKPPVKKNEGIRITRIIEGLAQKGVIL